MRRTVRSGLPPGPAGAAGAEQADQPRSSTPIQRFIASPVAIGKNSLCSELVSGHNTLVAGKGGKKTRMDAVKLLPEVIRRLLAIADTDLLLHEVCTLASDALGADEVSLLLIDPDGTELVEHEVVGKKLRPTRYRLKVGDQGICGTAAAKREPVVVADVRRDKRYDEVHPEMRSEAAMPILSGEELLGILNFESKKIGYFQKSDVPVLSFLASQVAIALKMVELEQRGRTWQDRVAALHNLARLGGGAAPREAVMQRVVDAVRMTCGGHFAAVFQGD